MTLFNPTPRVVLLVATTLALAAAPGCGGNGGESDGAAEDEYPAEVVENFMTECESAAVDAAAISAEQARRYCRCSIDELQETVPLEEFLETEARIGEEGFVRPDEMNAAVQKCGAQVLGSVDVE